MRDRRLPGPLPHVVERGPGARDHETHVVAAVGPAEPVDQVVHALLGRDPRQEQHVPVALEAAPGQHLVDDDRRRLAAARVDGGIGDADPRPALGSERRSPMCVDQVGGVDDAVLRVLRHRDAVVVAEVAGEGVRGGTEALALDARSHDVRDVGPDRLGDGRDPRVAAHRATDRQRLHHDAGMGHQVERQAHGRHVLGEQLDQPTDHAGRVPTVGDLVVADRVGPFDGDAWAVGQHGVERLQRQSRQRLQRPGHDADVVEPAQQRGLGQVARLARVTADHRVGADHDHRVGR